MRYIVTQLVGTPDEYSAEMDADDVFDIVEDLDYDEVITVRRARFQGSRGHLRLIQGGKSEVPSTSD